MRRTNPKRRSKYSRYDKREFNGGGPNAAKAALKSHRRRTE